jgi:hypothetical protein
MFYIFMRCVTLFCSEALQWDCPLPFTWYFVLDVLKVCLHRNLIHNQLSQRAEGIAAEDKVTI